MRKYIVIVSPSYGGAEKRFFDIFTALRRSDEEIYLIAPAMLIEQLKADHPDRADVFERLLPVTLTSWSPWRFIRSYASLLRTLPRSSTFHYPMNCLWFLHIGRRDRLSLSVVNCITVPRLFSERRHATLNYIAFFFVRKIDVLSPFIFERVKDYMMGHKASLTPGGTFILPPKAIEAPKQPVVTFFSRLIKEKGILDFLDIAPDLWRALKDETRHDIRLSVAGYGPLESEVAARVTSLSADGIPITFEGFRTAHEVMSQAAVVLSLQTVTNYPSRIVAEALASGCAVVVRASGNSTDFGSDLPGLEYCRDRLDAAEMGQLIAGLVAKVCDDSQYCEAIHEAARRRFSSEHYLDYFRRNILAGDVADGPATTRAGE
jgi:glycosyltransferase involved in cell wall biosynthesis